MQVRPENCDHHLCDPVKKGGEPQKCPHCKQVHLRPGYCQALDPINAAKYPHLHQQALPKPNLAVTDDRDSVTLSVTPEDSVTDDETRECIECGERFEPQRVTARYCSAACRMRAARKRMG